MNILKLSQETPGPKNKKMVKSFKNYGLASRIRMKIRAVRIKNNSDKIHLNATFSYLKISRARIRAMFRS